MLVWRFQRPKFAIDSPPVERQPDISQGWFFQARFRPSTPLRLLKLHGIKTADVARPPPLTHPNFGGWSMELKSLRQMGLEIDGPPPVQQLIPGYECPDDPNLHIEFLKAVRNVVEQKASISYRIVMLQQELARPAWIQMIWRPGCDADSLVDFFFPEFLTTISGLTFAACSALRRAGLATPAGLRNAPDEYLLGLPGIEQRAVARVRAACASLPLLDHDDRIDTVQR